MKLGCYARVSKHEQQTLPLQRDAMVTYAQQRGWTIVVMVEEVSSGACERLQRQELLRAARRRTINADFRGMKPTHSARCDSQGFSGILVNWSAFL